MDESTCDRAIVSQNRPSKLECRDLIVNDNIGQRSKVDGGVVRRNTKHSVACLSMNLRRCEMMRDDAR